MAMVSYTLRDSVAVIEFSNPPVNSFDHALRRDVLAAVERANVDASARAVVLFGCGGSFSAGADVQELVSMHAARGPALPELVRAVESSSKPVVAAIEGDCLGGGLQLTLGCHYRVAEHSARLGLPEVKLGLLPSAGGTQRLPRLCGIPLALQMIVTGDTMPAADLAGTPLLDRVVTEDTLEAAVDLAASVAKQGRELPRTRDRLVNDRNAKLFFDQARLRAQAAAKGLIAPLRAIDAVEAAITQTFDEGIRVERSLFKLLNEGTESRALRHVFLAKRAAGRIADVPDTTPPRPIRSAAVLGAGTAGIGITLSFLDAGIPVRWLDVGEEALERSCERIRESYESSLKRGRLTKKECDRRLELLTPINSYAELADADIVVEAVFDELTIKQHAFATLDRTMKRGSILATHTASLDVNRVARATRRPADVVGLHLWGAPNPSKLLEIIRGEDTADDVLVTVVRLARQLGKVPVVSRPRNGFLGNRLLARFLEQALLMVEEGASPYDIDAAIEHFGFAMGPFRMSDLAGTDIQWVLRRHRQEARDISTLDDGLCELGRSGRGALAGWYDYRAEDGKACPSSVVTDFIHEFRAARNIVPRQIDAAEMVDRLVLALVNEGSRLLEERQAERASDVDLIAVTGYGFPKWRGGPLFHADFVGLDRIMRRMRELENNPRADPSCWRPSLLVQRLVAEQKTFRSLDRPFSA